MRNHAVLTLSRPAALRRGAILFALAWAVFGVATIGAGSAYADEQTGQTDHAVTVMTQNLYQGTEFRHIQELLGKAEVSFPEALAATTADYTTYVKTRFKDRAKQIASEIVQNKPVLVGLQEVATWYAGAFKETNPFGLPDPPPTEDFTQELIKAIAADGMQYEAVSRHDNNFTLAFPIVTEASFPYPGANVGMVESGVILARTDLPPGQLKLSNPASGTYAAKIILKNPITEPPSPIPFTNSWQSIDAKVRGRAFRFITTHLDALDSTGTVRYFQAKELATVAASSSLPVVVTGDMNSGLKSSPAAYGALLEGGLSDTWTAAGLGEPPLTCCHLAPKDLATDPLAPYTDDLDHVLTRGNYSVLDEHLVGNKAPASPPSSFIWPSDHAGVVATLAVGK